MQTLARPVANTTKYGIKSLKYQLVLDWNKLQRLRKDLNLASASLSKVKTIVKNL